MRVRGGGYRSKVESYRGVFGCWVIVSFVSFLIDKLSKKWRPHFFVENKLSGFLDQAR